MRQRVAHGLDEVGLAIRQALSAIPHPRFPSRVLAVTFYLGTAITGSSLAVIAWTLNVETWNQQPIEGHVVVSCVFETSDPVPTLWAPGMGGMLLQNAFLSFLHASAAAVTHGLRLDVRFDRESPVVGVVFDRVAWSRPAENVPLFMERGFESAHCPWVVVLLNHDPAPDSRSWERMHAPSRLTAFSYTVGEPEVSRAVRDLYSDRDFLRDHFSRLSALHPSATHAFVLMNRGLERTYFEFPLESHDGFGYASLDAITEFRVTVLPTYLFSNEVVGMPRQNGSSVPSPFAVDVKYPTEFTISSVVSNWPYSEIHEQGEEFKALSLTPATLEANASSGRRELNEFSRVHLVARDHGRGGGEQALLIGASTALGAGVSSMLEAVLASGVFGLLRARRDGASEIA